MAPDRYVLTCNGGRCRCSPPAQWRVRRRRALPRLAARSCLHPTIGVHAPLVFDMVDTWMQRSLGGCQYHVAHPGGAASTFPVNAFEAESRRLARFFRFGHTPGKVQVKPWSQRRAPVYARLAAFLTPDSRLFPAGNLHSGRAHALILMARTLLAIYLQSPRRYDEMLAADGGAAALAKVLRSS
jgi:hypothetical protein